MSGLVMGMVLKYSRSRGNARMVAVVLGDACRDDGSGAWPSLRTIAERSGVSERTAQRCLRELEELGELTIRYKAGPKECNLYDIPIDKWGGVKLSPGGDNATPRVVTKTTGGGDTAMSPDPSGSVLSVDPSNTDPRFELFWNLYPKKTGKLFAHRAWKKLGRPVLGPALFAIIMGRLKTYANVECKDREKQYIKDPATWLNGHHWDDEVIAPALPTRGVEQRPAREIPLFKAPTLQEQQEREHIEHQRWLERNAH